MDKKQKNNNLTDKDLKATDYLDEAIKAAGLNVEKLKATDYLDKHQNELNNLINNDFLNKSNIEKESSLKTKLDNKEKELNDLKEKLEKQNFPIEEKEELEEIIKQRELSLFNMENELKVLQSNEKQVEDTIEFIEKLPTEHLSALKTNLADRIKFFNCIGKYSLIITALTFLGYLVALILNLPAPTTGVSYFNNVFFIVFPTIVAFTAFRQSNLKSKELEKINEKLLNSNYLVASLKAIQKISTESDTNKEVLVSINKLVDSILNVSNESQMDDKDINLTSSQLSTILKNMSSMAKT